jgi:hypothetical protein
LNNVLKSLKLGRNEKHKITTIIIKTPIIIGLDTFLSFNIEVFLLTKTPLIFLLVSLNPDEKKFVNLFLYSLS